MFGIHSSLSQHYRRILASITAIAGVVSVLAVTLSPAVALPNDPAPSAAGRYIVVLEDGVLPAPAAAAMGKAYGLQVGHVYAAALSGFAAVVPDARLRALRSDPRVVSVQPDEVVSIDHCIPGHPKHGDHCDPTTTTSSTTTSSTTTTTSTSTSTTSAGGGQVVPTGVARIGGPSGQDVTGVAVAVIDTGIDLDHPDLNVVGGVNCSKGTVSNYDDGHGHGTHVAGTIGAIDNDLGVIGVAPGVPLYAVRVLNNAGMGFRSDIICGIDWVAANGGEIDVANMSLGGIGSDDGRSCTATTDAYKKSICGAVAAGVTVVVAAGNDGDDAANHVPAAYDMVITVSALADFDGAPGGSASPTCRSDQDDTFADFSNHGADVDIIAPGVCILSTWTGGGYNTISGTSMATPHVAGAAAVYVAGHPLASPDEVRSALIAGGNGNWNAADDPDGTKEPLLATP